MLQRGPGIGRELGVGQGEDVPVYGVEGEGRGCAGGVLGLKFRRVLVPKPHRVASTKCLELSVRNTPRSGNILIGYGMVGAKKTT